MNQEFDLTTADLIVLGFLKQHPMHGYELNETLERCDSADWAGVSRPQIYYSMNKLAGAKLLRPRKDKRPAAGPSRRVYEVTEAGSRALAKSLEETRWATQRTIPPFLTWMALCGHARGQAISKLIEVRREFLRAEVHREEETLESMGKEVSFEGRAAILMIGLTIRHMEVELSWLDEVEATLVPRPRDRA